MKGAAVKQKFILITVVCLLAAAGVFFGVHAARHGRTTSESGTTAESSSAGTQNISLTLNGSTFSVEPEDNETAAAFQQMLPVTLSLSELHGNEKYVYLDESLPSDAEPVQTIHAGDLLLYGDNCIVLFYKTFTTTYSYTKIGHISDTAGLAEAVGNGAVTVSFSY